MKNKKCHPIYLQINEILNKYVRGDLLYYNNQMNLDAIGWLESHGYIHNNMKIDSHLNDHLKRLATKIFTDELNDIVPIRLDFPIKLNLKKYKCIPQDVISNALASLISKGFDKSNYTDLILTIDLSINTSDLGSIDEYLFEEFKLKNCESNLYIDMVKHYNIKKYKKILHNILWTCASSNYFCSIPITQDICWPIIYDWFKLYDVNICEKYMDTQYLKLVINYIPEKSSLFDNAMKYIETYVINKIMLDVKYNIYNVDIRPIILKLPSYIIYTEYNNDSVINNATNNSNIITNVTQQINYLGYDHVQFNLRCDGPYMVLESELSDRDINTIIFGNATRRIKSARK